MGIFKIDADNFSWIQGTEDDPNDLCLHGHAVADIGNHRLEYDATVSATALYLLKSLTENHMMYEDNQMLPCCGFFYLPNESLDNVVISGCPNGIDWTIKHENDEVVLILPDGIEERVPMEEYREEVFWFADKIEDYYNQCKPKVLPEEKFERDGYLAFWNEWHRRRRVS